MDEHRIARVRVNRGGRVEETTAGETVEEPGVAEEMAADDRTAAEIPVDGSGADKNGLSVRADGSLAHGHADADTDATSGYRTRAEDASGNRQDPQRKANY
jgi:hypothetical protein